MTHINEFAERLLLGNTLKDKLHSPESIDKISFKPTGYLLTQPEFPGRPNLLDLANKGNKKRIQFPSLGQIERDPKMRGIVLHFFANHELLAIELMALAILKFQDINLSPKFKLGIFHTICEEQNHMRLYLKQMEKYGVEFGEVPVSSFFWDCLKSMDDPRQYLSGMSLTFEQANLDYSLYYQNLFNKLDDKETQDILSKVYLEEIGHVQFGVSWMKRFEPQKKMWDAYLQYLPQSLVPIRAKGRFFDKQGRKKAGLDSEYISKLFLYQYSKGKVPTVYYFNPNVEMELLGLSGSEVENHNVRKLKQDLEIIMMYFSTKEDVVLVSTLPSDSFQMAILASGFQLPQFCVFNLSHSEFKEKGNDSYNSSINTSLNIPGDSLVHRKIGSIFPWGWTSQSYQFLKPLIKQSRDYLTANHFLSKSVETEDWENRKELHSKEKAIGLIQSFNQKTDLIKKNKNLSDSSFYDNSLSSVFNDMDEFYKQSKKLYESGYSKLLVKANLGTSGQNQKILNFKEMHRQELWVTRQLKLQKKLILEPFHNRVCDFSYHFLAKENDIKKGLEIVELGMVRFFTSGRGQFLGVYVGRAFDVFTKEVKEFLYKTFSHEKFAQEYYAALGSSVTKFLTAYNYKEPVGINTYIYREHGALKFRPLVEINPRFTMGLLGIKLGKRVHKHSFGFWGILKCTTVNRIKISSLLNKYKIEVDFMSGQISKGALCTNEFYTETKYLSLLLVHNTLQSLRLMMSEFEFNSFEF